MSVMHEAHRRASFARESATSRRERNQPLPWSRSDLPAVVVLVVAAALLLSTAPTDGAYWWSDAPRHALNGAFVRDLVADMPVQAPRQWAVDYYFRYPALTILFYPPLFPAAEAVVFAVLGVSPWSAQLTVTLFCLLAGLSAYGLARRWMARGPALGAAILFLGLPEAALWGRQVMLELPACALLIAAVWAFVHYLGSRRPAALYAATGLFVLTLYTKQTALFMVPVLGAALLVAHGTRALRERHLWIAATAAVLALAPLAWMTLEFGGTNLQSVSGVQDAAVARASLANWTWYLRSIPDQVGWPVALLAATWSALAAWGRGWRLPRTAQTLVVGWFVAGYGFFSLVSLKEPRFTLLILFPVALAVVWMLARILPPRAAAAAALALGAGVFLHTLATRPVPTVIGYAEAAGWVATQAPDDSVVLFSGLRDGSFIFNLRSHEERDDLAVIRADKLLLSLAVRRTLGVEQVEISEPELRDRLNRLGVRYVVADPDFWSDLENMQMLQGILESAQFERLATIPVRSDLPYAEREIRIYRNLGPVAAEPEPFTMRLEMVDRTITPSGR